MEKKQRKRHRSDGEEGESSQEEENATQDDEPKKKKWVVLMIDARNYEIFTWQNTFNVCWWWVSLLAIKLVWNWRDDIGMDKEKTT